MRRLVCVFVNIIDVPLASLEDRLSSVALSSPLEAMGRQVKFLTRIALRLGPGEEFMIFLYVERSIADWRVALTRPLGPGGAATRMRRIWGRTSWCSELFADSKCARAIPVPLTPGTLSVAESRQTNSIYSCLHQHLPTRCQLVSIHPLFPSSSLRGIHRMHMVPVAYQYDAYVTPAPGGTSSRRTTEESV